MENEILLLVFYIFRDTLQQDMVREQYMSSIKKHFDSLGLKTAIFFLPTDTEERIECLNPKYIEDQNEIAKLKEILSNAEKIFDIQNTQEEKINDKLDMLFSELLTDDECKELKSSYKVGEEFNNLDIPNYSIIKNRDLKKAILTFHMLKFLETANNDFKIEREDLEFIKFIDNTDNVSISLIPVFDLNDKVYVCNTKYFKSIEEVILMIENVISSELEIVIYVLNIDNTHTQLGLKRAYFLRYAIID